MANEGGGIPETIDKKLLGWSEDAFKEWNSDMLPAGKLLGFLINDVGGTVEKVGGAAAFGVGAAYMGLTIGEMAVLDKAIGQPLENMARRSVESGTEQALERAEKLDGSPLLPGELEDFRYLFGATTLGEGKMLTVNLSRLQAPGAMDYLLKSADPYQDLVRLAEALILEALRNAGRTDVLNDLANVAPKGIGEKVGDAALNYSRQNKLRYLASVRWLVDHIMENPDFAALGIGFKKYELTTNSGDSEKMKKQTLDSFQSQVKSKALFHSGSLEIANKDITGNQRLPVRMNKWLQYGPGVDKLVPTAELLNAREAVGIMPDGNYYPKLAKAAPTVIFKREGGIWSDIRQDIETSLLLASPPITLDAEQWDALQVAFYEFFRDTLLDPGGAIKKYQESTGIKVDKQGLEPDRDFEKMLAGGRTNEKPHYVFWELLENSGKVYDGVWGLLYKLDKGKKVPLTNVISSINLGDTWGEYYKNISKLYALLDKFNADPNFAALRAAQPDLVDNVRTDLDDMAAKINLTFQTQFVPKIAKAKQDELTQMLTEWRVTDIAPEWLKDQNTRAVAITDPAITEQRRIALVNFITGLTSADFGGGEEGRQQLKTIKRLLIEFTGLAASPEIGGSLEGFNKSLDTATLARADLLQNYSQLNALGRELETISNANPGLSLTQILDDRGRVPFDQLEGIANRIHLIRPGIDKALADSDAAITQIYDAIKNTPIFVTFKNRSGRSLRTPAELLAGYFNTNSRNPNELINRIQALTEMPLTTQEAASLGERLGNFVNTYSDISRHLIDEVTYDNPTNAAAPKINLLNYARVLDDESRQIHIRRSRERNLVNPDPAIRMSLFLNRATELMELTAGGRPSPLPPVVAGAVEAIITGSDVRLVEPPHYPIKHKLMLYMLNQLSKIPANPTEDQLKAAYTKIATDLNPPPGDIKDTIQYILETLKDERNFATNRRLSDFWNDLHIEP